MTDIRELLRTATSDLQPAVPDPVPTVRRAVARRRYGLTAVAAAVVAVVGVISVGFGAFSTTSDGMVGVNIPGPPTPSTVQHWAPGDTAVATGMGSIWALEGMDQNSTSNGWVDKLNPQTGALVARIRVPGPAAHIAVGAGSVWTIGASDGGPSSISAIVASNVHLATPRLFRVTSRLTNEKAAPAAIAIADGSAWVTMPRLNQVWRLSVSQNSSIGLDVIKQVVPVTGSPTAITANDGVLWVQSARGRRLSEIDPRPGPGHVRTTFKVSGNLLGSEPHAGPILTGGPADPETVTSTRTMSCAAGDQCPAPGVGLGMDGRTAQVAIHSSRGVFISTDDRVYYVDSADWLFRRGPTASIAVTDGSSIATDGRGVVIGTASGLVHWVPAG